MTGEKAELTTRSIRRRSPIQVVTPPSLVELRCSDENRYFADGMVVNMCALKEYASHSFRCFAKDKNDDRGKNRAHDKKYS